MNWHRISKYALRSECERWSVAKVSDGKTWAYEAWRTQSHPTGREMLDRCPDAEMAKRVCEQDQQQTRAAA